MQTLSLVLPAYNEEARIARTILTLLELEGSSGLPSLKLIEILIVNDGSRDGTEGVCAPLCERDSRVRVLTFPENRGKGAAVRAGIEAARGDWILVADADMATPWSEIATLARGMREHSLDVAIGSRDIAGSVITRHQSFLRENLGKTFNRFVRALTTLPYRDTQCGFKLMRRASVAPFLPDLRVDRFAWDVEFLLFAHRAGLKVEEIPVLWEHQDNSRVRVVRDGLEMVWSVAGVRARLALSSGKRKQTSF